MYDHDEEFYARKRGEPEATISLRREILKTFPNLCARVNGDQVSLWPQQTTFSWAIGWHGDVKTLEEARVFVEKFRSNWKEWNDRALGTYSRRKIEDPFCTREIRLIFVSEIKCFMSADHFALLNNPLLSGDWIVFEKQGRKWIETNDICHGLIVNGKFFSSARS